MTANAPAQKRNQPIFKGLMVASVSAVAIAAWTCHQQNLISLDVFGAPSPAAAMPVVVQRPAVIALGRIDPAGRILKVAAPANTDPATLLAINVKEEDVVARGSVLATLDTLPRLEAKRQEAWATVAVKRALHEKQLAVTQFDDGGLIAILQRFVSDRDRARWEVERGEQLKASGVVTENYIKERRLKLEAAEASIAETKMKLSRVRHRTDGSQSTVDLAVTAAELAAAEASARVAEAELERAYVRAPVDGHIVKIAARVGERVGNDGVMSIAAAGAMAIRAEAFESDVPRLRPGQQVSATAPAISGRINGTITRIGTEIARQSIMREDPSADTDARVVEVDISLDEASSETVRGLNNLRVRVRFED